MKDDRTKPNSRAQKNKIMKRTSKNSKSGLQSLADQQTTGNTGESPKSNLPDPSINFERRRANRALSAGQLLSLLQTHEPRFYELAELVGKWVWIKFDGKQPPTITGALAELGFHWNNRRQLWQHPGGQIRAREEFDPRSKYGSQFPSDLQPA